MGSLHARRPPKLEQGDLRRKSKRGANNSQIKGGGSLRRPPSADVPRGVDGSNGGNHSSRKKFWTLWRMTASVIVVILLTLMFMQLRDLLRTSKGSSSLRANQNAEINSLKTDAKPG